MNAQLSTSKRLHHSLTFRNLRLFVVSWQLNHFQEKYSEWSCVNPFGKAVINESTHRANGYRHDYGCKEGKWVVIYQFFKILMFAFLPSFIGSGSYAEFNIFLLGVCALCTFAFFFDEFLRWAAAPTISFPPPAQQQPPITPSSIQRAAAAPAPEAVPRHERATLHQTNCIHCKTLSSRRSRFVSSFTGHNTTFSSNYSRISISFTALLLHIVIIIEESKVSLNHDGAPSRIRQCRLLLAVT